MTSIRNDVDVDGDGVVEQADNSDTVDGQHASEIASDVPNKTETTSVSGGYVESGPDAPAWWDNDTTTARSGIVDSGEVITETLTPGTGWINTSDGIRVNYGASQYAALQDVTVHFDEGTSESVMSSHPGDGTFVEATHEPGKVIDYIEVTIEETGGGNGRDYNINEVQPHKLAVGRHDHNI